MNAMGHNVPTLIGVDHSGLAKQIGQLIPDYMVMGERGMADMGEMTMPLPDNTLPMMTGTGPYGPIEMGGMFSTLKVRKDQQPGDYSDPGWFKQPPGTQAFEWTGSLPVSQTSPAVQGKPSNAPELRVKKPGAGQHNH
jgi:hypothetical protein